MAGFENKFKFMHTKNAFKIQKRALQGSHICVVLPFWISFLVESTPRGFQFFSVLSFSSKKTCSVWEQAQVSQGLKKTEFNGIEQARVELALVWANEAKLSFHFQTKQGGVELDWVSVWVDEVGLSNADGGQVARVGWKWRGGALPTDSFFKFFLSMSLSLHIWIQVVAQARPSKRLSNKLWGYRWEVFLTCVFVRLSSDTRASASLNILSLASLFCATKFDQSSYELWFTQHLTILEPTHPSTSFLQLLCLMCYQIQLLSNELWFAPHLALN